jgi:hypothetical protein
MADEFQEKYKADIALFDTTGATAEQISQYFDMLNYSRIDFVAQTKQIPLAANSTAAGSVVLRLLSASNATGGGASAISSATVTIGRTSTGGIVALANRANEIYIQFTTLASGATFSVGGYDWSFDSTADVTARILDSTGATGQASVAMEAFATAFNSTANNPIATAWACATVSSGLCVIRPLAGVDPTTYLTATGSTKVNVGIGRSIGHLGLDVQHLGDGKRYVAIGSKSSNNAVPIVITVFRESQKSPVVQYAVQASKSMGASTSK